MKPHVSVCLFAALLTLPASAAIRYQSTTQTLTEGAGKPVKMVVEGLVDGEKVRVEFKDSNNPLMGKGTYIVSADGGKSLFLVNPKDEVYSRFELDELAQLMGGMMNAMGGLVKLEMTHPKVEKVLDEAGGELLGLPTRHVETRSSYGMSVKVFGMKQESFTESVQSVWTTTALADVGLGVWLRKEPPSTGNEQLDALMQGEWGKVDGFPLKMVITSTSTDKKKGKATKSTTTMEVTKVETGLPAPAASTFEVPKGYEEQPLTPFGQGEGNPFEELMKGR